MEYLLSGVKPNHFKDFGHVHQVTIRLTNSPTEAEYNTTHIHLQQFAADKAIRKIFYTKEDIEHITIFVVFGCLDELKTSLVPYASSNPIVAALMQAKV